MGFCRIWDDPIPTYRAAAGTDRKVWLENDLEMNDR